jgi:hypothetical protein
VRFAQCSEKAIVSFRSLQYSLFSAGKNSFSKAYLEEFQMISRSFEQVKKAYEEVSIIFGTEAAICRAVVVARYNAR